jgi:aquaporin Z
MAPSCRCSWPGAGDEGAGVSGHDQPALIGASVAALLLHEVIKVSARYGSNYPARSHSDWQAFLMEALLMLGLVSVILGTASGARNIGIFGAIGVGGYIALAGLWGSPISGASMNHPARTFGPDLVARNFGSYRVYVVGPLLGAFGGGGAGSAADQGDPQTDIQEPERA